jgi:hypothetical protein
MSMQLFPHELYVGGVFFPPMLLDAALGLAAVPVATINPPPGDRTKSVMSRSISPESRTSIALSSTFRNGPTAWIAPN